MRKTALRPSIPWWVPGTLVLIWTAWLLVLAAAASAQSVPNGTITQGQIWTTAQWNNAFQLKADVTSGTLTGPTINGGTLAGSTISNPTITGGTQSAPTITGAALTSPNITTPAVTGGTFSSATLSSPTINGSMTLNGAISIAAPSLSPANNVPNGSVGLGTEFNLTTRTGGFGQYGNVLNEYLVTAAIPAAQFDVNQTSWVTATNLTGGAVFAAWDGANTPASALGETFSGGSILGREINAGNRWADFGLQSDVGGTRYTVGQQIVPDVVPTTDTATTTVTMTAGTPGVVNWTANSLPLNTPVTFGGSGTLPASLTAGAVFFVTAPSTNTFQVSASVNGTAISFASNSSGTITAIPEFPGSFAEVIGPSIHGHKWWVGHLNRFDTIMPGGHADWINGASASNGNVPLDAINLGGFWTNGIDLSNAGFSGTAIQAPSISIANGSANYPVPKMSWGAIVGGTSTCSISGAQGSSGFASCAGSTGVYVINFTANYTSAPVCTGNNDINSPGAYSVQITTSVTQAQVNLGLSGTPGTGTINVTCMGL